MITTQLGQGRHPIRLDVMLHAGQLWEDVIPVYGGDGVLLDLTGWTASAVTLTADGSTLATLSFLLGPDGLTLQASKATTTAWGLAWPLHSPLRVNAAHPSGEPVFEAAGWFSLYR